jgi:hypothetical protein
MIFSQNSPSELLALGAWSVDAVRAHLHKALVHHATEGVGGLLVLGHLLLGGGQLVLQLREPGHLLVDGVLLDDQLELVVLDFLLRASTLTTDLHQETSGASGFCKSKKNG